jgi:hypothetical protein
MDQAPDAQRLLSVEPSANEGSRKRRRRRETSQLMLVQGPKLAENQSM